MPRKSAASMEVVKITTDDRLAPPRKLNRAEKALWRSIVDSLPANFFRSSDVPLLANYCRHSVRSDYLAEELAADPRDVEVDRMLRGASTTLASLATKLRLCPNARVERKSAMLNKPESENRPWQTQRGR